MEPINSILESINHWHWFGLASVLICLEVSFGANFFLLWLGICATSIGAILFFYPQMPGEYQLLLFAFESLACLVFWHWHLKFKSLDNVTNINRRSEQYIGRIVTLNEPIVNNRGKIHIDDSFWRVEGPNLPAKTQVKIIAVEGVILKVDKVN